MEFILVYLPLKWEKLAVDVIGSWNETTETVAAAGAVAGTLCIDADKDAEGTLNDNDGCDDGGGAADAGGFPARKLSKGFSSMLDSLFLLLLLFLIFFIQKKRYPLF